MTHTSFKLIVPALVFTSSLFFAAGSARAEAPAGSPTNQIHTVAAPDPSPEIMRAFLHLQEQLHTTQMAVERSRLESEAAAARSAQALEARLKIIEDAVGRASKEHTDAIIQSNQKIQESNSRMVLLGGCFAVLVLAAMGVAGWAQWKAAARMGSVSPAGFPPLLPQGQGYSSMGSGGQAQLVNAHLMSVLGRLEHRIAEMESGHDDARPLKVVPMTEHDVDAADSSDTTADSSPDTPLAGVLRQGDDLLASDRAEAAVDYFDKLLGKFPGNAELLLRKGTALERLQRDQEAIDCYDLAIKSDPHLTMAYLHKGGLFNRMERFGEAMECYEQALRVQENRRTA